MNSGSSRNTFVEAVLVHVPVHIQVFSCRERELSLRVLVGSIEGVVAVGTAGDAQDRDAALGICPGTASASLLPRAGSGLGSPCAPSAPKPTSLLQDLLRHFSLRALEKGWPKFSVFFRVNLSKPRCGGLFQSLCSILCSFYKLLQRQGKRRQNQ